MQYLKILSLEKIFHCVILRILLKGWFYDIFYSCIYWSYIYVSITSGNEYGHEEKVYS